MRRTIGSCLPLLVACGGSAPGSDASEQDSTTDAASADADTASTSAGPDDGPGPDSADDGGTSDGSDDTGTTGPHIIEPCPTDVGAVGVWEEITPPSIEADGMVPGFGVFEIAVDPLDPRNVYFGATDLGLFRSTDCGATFEHVNTGTLGPDLDAGATLFTLDPVDAGTVYTSALYGPNGFFKSTNGGVDFTQILTPNIQDFAPYGGFVGGTVMDPADHEHLVLTWHDVCKEPYNASCFAETHDGGVTWELRNGEPGWLGGEGTFMNMLTSDIWLFSSSQNGMWRSTDAGDSWAQLENVAVAHGSGQHYRVGGGVHYLGTANGVIYTEDDGMTWSALPNSGFLIMGVIGNGEDVWASNAFPYNTGDHPEPFMPFYTAKMSDPQTWSTLETPLLTSGAASMAYDPDHHILYSANFWEGAWRVVVE